MVGRSLVFLYIIYFCMAIGCLHVALIESCIRELSNENAEAVQRVLYLSPTVSRWAPHLQTTGLCRSYLVALQLWVALGYHLQWRHVKGVLFTPHRKAVLAP